MKNHPWYAAKSLPLQVAPHIRGDFSYGFDDRIPEETRRELLAFISWVEGNFPVPVTLWVDFEYRHYLMTRDKKRAGYLFYWADFSSWPVFDKEEDIPSIRLPVRREHWSMEEILFSFIEAITCYYVWLANGLTPEDDYKPPETEVEEILQAYLTREQR